MKSTINDLDKHLDQGFPSQGQQYNSLIRAVVSKTVNRQSVDGISGTKRRPTITYKRFTAIQINSKRIKKEFRSLEIRPQWQYTVVKHKRQQENKFWEEIFKEQEDNNVQYERLEQEKHRRRIERIER